MYLCVYIILCRELVEFMNISKRQNLYCYRNQNDVISFHTKTINKTYKREHNENGSQRHTNKYIEHLSNKTNNNTHEGKTCIRMHIQTIEFFRRREHQVSTLSTFCRLKTYDIKEPGKADDSELQFKQSCEKLRVQF